MTQKSPLVVIPVNCRAGLSAARSRANVLSVSGSTMDSARSQALAKYYRVQADACRQMAQQASDRGGKAVVFDLVKPVRAARDCLGAGGEAKLDGRKNAP